MAKFALIIAIPQYDNFKPLPNTTQDGETIAQNLRSYGDYEITRLPKKGNADKADYEMKAGKVTVNQLYDTLKLFLDETAKDQAALIYFTGHGFTICDRLGRKKGYLATSNCQVKVKDERIIEQENGFPLEDLDYLIQKANLSELVVLLDCCHSGNFIETHLMRDSLKTFEHKQNYYLITACRSYETAKSIRKDEHSVFSGAVIEGLSPQNKDQQGKISCDRLFDYINTQIGGKLQSPLRMGIGDSITLVKYSVTGTEKIPEIEPILDGKGEIVCPYQGLLAFTKTELPFFFGRKQVVEELKSKLERQPFVFLIGASGSGKSSVVLAGLIPWLEKAGWQVLDPIKPGFKPLARLEEVLRQKYFSEEEQLLDECIHDESSEGLKPLLERLLERFPQGRHLLVVDQFEELFTVAEAKQRDRFIHLITQVTDLPNSPLGVCRT
ncbi:MAG: caspase family protein [Waterburya sp.]